MFLLQTNRIFSVSLSLLGMAFWLWMIVECVNKEPDHGNEKLIWLLVIVLAHIPGAVIYFLFRRPNRLSLYGH